MTKTTSRLMLGDCLKRMKEIPDESVDMVMADPPYGTTACKWDSVIPLKPMWEQLKRVIKKNGAIVLMAGQPFTSVLVMSNIEMFRHEWIYQKRCASNFAQAKYAPMKEHELVIVFSHSKPPFFPIKEKRKGGIKKPKARAYKPGKFVQKGSTSFGGNSVDNSRFYKSTELRFPSSVQEFNNRSKGSRGIHPTQKPVALMKYLIKTYTNPGELVLDFAMGSGTTGVACKNLGRNFIGIELDCKYFIPAKVRIYRA